MKFELVRVWQPNQLSQAQAHVSRIETRGVQAYLDRNEYRIQVWKQIETPDFMVLAEPEWVQELSLTEEGQHEIETKDEELGHVGTWADTATKIIAKRTKD